MKLPTFRVENGLGKHIVFSALIPELHRVYGDINIISAYNDVFENNPMVKNSWSIDYVQSHKDEVIGSIGKIYTHEPYKGEYSLGIGHIIESWCKAYGLNSKNVTKPQIFTNDEVKSRANEIIKETNGKFFLTQFSGGQPPIGFNPEVPYQHNLMQLNRNYPVQMATILVNKLSKLYPGYTFIDFTLPNEPMVYGTTRVVAPYLVYYELCKQAKEVICIDSSLGHFAAGADKKAHVLWNSLAEATPENYGWSIHKNISAPNLTIDYDIIVDSIKRR